MAASGTLSQNIRYEKLKILQESDAEMDFSDEQSN